MSLAKSSWMLEVPVYLLARAAALVDLADASLDVHATLDRSQHLVARSEYALEEAELL